MSDATPLSTAEVTAQANVASAVPLSGEDRAAAYMARRARVDALVARWAVWLAGKYLSGYAEATAGLVFRQAWDLGHADGYGAVESLYDDFAGLVVEAVGYETKS